MKRSNSYKVSLIETTKALYPEIRVTKKREQYITIVWGRWNIFGNAMASYSKNIRGILYFLKFLHSIFSTYLHWKVWVKSQQVLKFTETEVMNVKQSYFNSSGNDRELTTVLNAISQVSTKMTKNIKILAQQRQSEKGERR